MKNPLTFRRLVVLTLAAGALSFFAGCSTPTAYQRIGNNKEGGYSSQRRGNDAYSVTFQGPEDSNPEQIYDYALLRSAELTIECGFKFFVVTSDNDRSRSSFRYTPPVAGIPTTTYHTTSMGRTYYHTSYSPTLPGHAYRSKIPIFTLDIKMYADTPGKDSPASLTYEAIPLVAQLKTKYQLK